MFSTAFDFIFSVYMWTEISNMHVWILYFFVFVIENGKSPFRKILVYVWM